MALANVISGRRKSTYRAVLYGLDGVGKSTFAAGAPSPIFLGTEDGTNHLDVTRFPEPKTFADVQAAVATLFDENHTFSTLVVDSLDWLEPIIWRHVCALGNKASIEDFGYGKGYTQAVDFWRGLLASIDELRAKKAMHVVLIAHAKIKAKRNPEGDDYDHYVLKLHEASAGVVREWADAVLFSQYETHTVEDEKSGRVKGISTGRRILQTSERAAFDAKNRFALPQTLSLSWQSFEDAVLGADPKVVSDRCSALLALIPDAEKRAKGEAHLAKHATDIHKLNELENRLKEMTK